MQAAKKNGVSRATEPPKVIQLFKTPGIERVHEFVRSDWANDPVMCVALTYGLEISSVTRQGNSLDVSCAFFQDPADLDEVAYKLFDYAKECCDYGFFPASIHRMDMHTRYIWKDSVGCENLTLDHEWEHMGLDVETFQWDDPTFPLEIFTDACDRMDADAIAVTLIKLHSGDVKIPEFVPHRLRPLFQTFMDDYLKRQGQAEVVANRH